MNPYLKQKAAPWVTLAVLVGGLVAAVILFFIDRAERASGVLTPPTEEEIFSQLEKKS